MADEGRATPGQPSKNEKLKAGSDSLRGSLAEELAGADASVNGAAANLLKFHGVYQQDDRDERAALRASGAGGREHSFMVRTKLPGGAVTATVYAELDRLAGTYGNGTLRVTTRQDIQFHGVLKRNLKRTLREVNDALITTLGACGDVVRNVVVCPAPTAENERYGLQSLARAISDRFLPRTRAYAELFLDGDAYAPEKTDNLQPDGVPEEPFYGETYLPRKFKIGLALPHDNCLEVHTNDLGLLAVLEENGNLRGWDVLVGGGLGMSFGSKSTYPKLAEPVAFARPHELMEIIDAIVGIQRDNGNRSDRKQARIKYLLDRWGVERFREEMTLRLGRTPEPAVNQRVLGVADHLGWGEQSDGRFFLGLHVENGRIKDEGRLLLRTALRLAVQRFHLGVHFTPQQNLLLTGVAPDDREALVLLLHEHRVSIEAPLAMRRAAMACPALPTCGLALAEAERALPAVVDELEGLLVKLGLEDEPLSVRMTGCPNGCARPWVADLGFVGRTANAYNVYVGGNPEGTRLNTLVAELVPAERLAETVRPLLELYRRQRRLDEGFGDFCLRRGPAALAKLIAGASAAMPAGAPA